MNKLKKYALSSLYDMASGISSTKEQAGHGSPFVSFSTVFNNYFLPDELPDLMDTSAKEQEVYSIKKGDILITRTSETIDELAMSCVATKDYPCATYSGFTKRLRPKTEGIAYYKYMAFYLRSAWFRKAVTNNAFMTLRASFNEDIFSFLNVYLPDYDVQVRIGDFLYSIEQKIGVNKQICTELESMAKTIYDYWFSQFDFPDADGKPYRSSGGAMVWNDQLQRKIPKGWEVGTINNLMHTENTSVNPKKLGKTVMEHYSIPAFDADHHPAYEEASTIESNKYAVDPECILTSKLNPHFKRLWDPFSDTENAICSTEFIVYRPRTSWTRPFCYAVLDSDAFYVHMSSKATASTGSRKRIQPDVSASFELPIPDENTMRYFVELYGPIMEKQKALYKENRELTKLRDWLLPMLMNGQATVAD